MYIKRCASLLAGGRTGNYDLRSLVLLYLVTMSAPELGRELPPRLRLLKEEIASSVPDFEARVTAAWADLLGELEKITTDIAKEGTKVRCRFRISVTLFEV